MENSETNERADESPLERSYVNPCRDSVVIMRTNAIRDERYGEQSLKPHAAPEERIEAEPG